MKDIAKILGGLRNNPEAQAMMKDRARPESPEEEVREYTETARKLGYDVTEEDLRNYLAETWTALRQRTEASAGRIRELPEEELGEAAGGGDHKECYDTYKDRENCWWTDGCDMIHENYHGYQCHLHSECSKPPEYPCQMTDSCHGIIA